MDVISEASPPARISFLKHELQAHQDEGGRAQNFLIAMRAACVGRTLFVTSGDGNQPRRVGLVPADSRPADAVVILKGGAWPFVLRPTGEEVSGEPMYNLVGPAYVHGIMHGEEEAAKKTRPGSHAIDILRMVEECRWSTQGARCLQLHHLHSTRSVRICSSLVSACRTCRTVLARAETPRTRTPEATSPISRPSCGTSPERRVERQHPLYSG